jgi:hypothetical protein
MIVVVSRLLGVSPYRVFLAAAVLREPEDAVDLAREAHRNWLFDEVVPPWVDSFCGVILRRIQPYQLKRILRRIWKGG